MRIFTPNHTVKIIKIHHHFPNWKNSSTILLESPSKFTSWLPSLQIELDHVHVHQLVLLVCFRESPYRFLRCTLSKLRGYFDCFYYYLNFLMALSNLLMLLSLAPVSSFHILFLAVMVAGSFFFVFLSFHLRVMIGRRSFCIRWCVHVHVQQKFFKMKAFCEVVLCCITFADGFCLFCICHTFGRLWCLEFFVSPVPSLRWCFVFSKQPSLLSGRRRGTPIDEGTVSRDGYGVAFCSTEEYFVVNIFFGK